MAVYECGTTAPSFEPPPAEPDARQRAWTVIRIKRVFSVPDLIAQAGMSQSNAEKFVSQLRKARYLAYEGRRQPNGTPGSYRLYRLIRDTGPSAPVVSAPRRRKAEVRHG